jgi:hypothetical protein
LGFDTLLLWMGSKGYRLIDCRQVSGKILVSFQKAGRASGFLRKNLPELNLQWGKVSLRSSGDRYLRWYSFERWADPKILVGIVKAQTELGFSRRERLACAWVAFGAQRTVRSFRWLIKALI